jgi:hypothetical protein
MFVYYYIILLMRNSILLLCIFFSLKAFTQPGASRWVRAFPVTGYFNDIGDSIKVVQVRLPDGVTVPEKQLGLLRGIYRDKHSDTVVIGAGRCHLIKGDYYYFTINYKQSGRQPREGDLLFTMVDPTEVYNGQVLKLASYFIGLQNVYEKAFYDRDAIFSNWEKSNEATLVDSLVADIHFTGNYFLENNPQMNVKIKGGRYDGSSVLNTMVISNRKDVIDFLDYVIARPRLYAGHEWKISEIFATWLSEGAPTVVKE